MVAKHETSAADFFESHHLQMYGVNCRGGRGQVFGSGMIGWTKKVHASVFDVFFG